MLKKDFPECKQDIDTWERKRKKYYLFIKSYIAIKRGKSTAKPKIG